MNELPPMELGQHRAEPDRKIEEEVEVPPGGGRQRVERHTAGVLHHERAALAVAEKLARSRDARHREIAHQLPLTLEPPGAERGFAVRRLQQDSQPIREAPGAVKRTPLVDEQSLSDVVTRNAHAWRRRSLLSPDPAREICRETVGHAALGYEQVGGFQRVLEEHGGQVVKKLWSPLNTADYAPYVAQFPECDVVCEVLAGSNPLKFTKQARGLGMKQPLAGGSTVADDTIIGAHDESAAGLINTNPYSLDQQSEDVGRLGAVGAHGHRGDSRHKHRAGSHSACGRGRPAVRFVLAVVFLRRAARSGRRPRVATVVV